jgi:hypothetical protein
MATKWEELRAENGAPTVVPPTVQMTRSLPDGALWVGYGGMSIRYVPDGTTRHLPLAFFAGHVLDCVHEPAGCSSVEKAQASAEAAVRCRLEENVEAMGGRIVWET